MSDDLPEYVCVCGMCNGRGEYRQTYTAGCGMGSYQSMGPCDICNRTGFVYKATYKPVPLSVVSQITAMRAATDGDAHADR